MIFWRGELGGESLENGGAKRCFSGKKKVKTGKSRKISQSLRKNITSFTRLFNAIETMVI